MSDSAAARPPATSTSAMPSKSDVSALPAELGRLLLQLFHHTAQPLQRADHRFLVEARPLHAQQHMVGAGEFPIAADLLHHLALRADDEAVGGEAVEVGADALGRHEA